MTAEVIRGIAMGADQAVLGPLLPSVVPDNEMACRERWTDPVAISPCLIHTTIEIVIDIL